MWLKSALIICLSAFGDSVPLGNGIETPMKNPMPALETHFGSGKFVSSTKLSDLMDTFVTCDDAVEFVGNNIGQDSVYVFITDASLAPSGARYVVFKDQTVKSPDRLEVYLAENQPQPKCLGHLLLEFVALARRNENTIHILAQDGLVERETYAINQEEFEYNSSQIFNQISMKCIKKKHWKEAANLNTNLIITNLNSFDKWLKMHLLHPSHINLLRNDWDIHYERPFCLKNPQHKLCQTKKEL